MSQNQIKTACVLMVGPDNQMDEVGDSNKFANPLPIKCSHCTFPDLDFVSKPYFLAKGIASTTEVSPAVVGNFLARERVRRILEVAAPNACAFYATAERKSKKSAPWWLCVPNHTIEIPVFKNDAPFCSKCGESKVWLAFNGQRWPVMNAFNSGGIDVFKSLAWHNHLIAEDTFEDTNRYRKSTGLAPLQWSYWGWGVKPPTHSERWTRLKIERELYFSVRLEQLLKRAKVKGQLVRALDFKKAEPSPEDEAWIAEKLKLLAEHGLVDAPKPAVGKAGKAGGAAQKWFQQFVKKNAAKESQAVDFAALEQQQKLPLPQDYKDFIGTVGEKSFADVNDKEGSTTTVLPPAKLDFKDYRRGKVPYLEGEDAEIDGVMFASTDFGDCLVFDVAAKGGDYPVFWYDHEENTMEPFAPNFAECIKRFAQKN